MRFDLMGRLSRGVYFPSYAGYASRCILPTIVGKLADAPDRALHAIQLSLRNVVFRISRDFALLGRVCCDRVFYDLSVWRR